MQIVPVDNDLAGFAHVVVGVWVCSVIRHNALSVENT